MKKIKSANLTGIDSLIIDVETTFTKGLPSFSIVGLANSSIQEAKDRVKSSLLTNDFKFPPKKIVVNLSPSDINKSGSHFDLCIALIICLYDEKVDFENFLVFGELGLSGEIKETNSIFPMILSLANEKKIQKVLVPSKIAPLISNIFSLEVYGVKDLNEAILFFKTEDKSKYKFNPKPFDFQKLTINKETYYYQNEYLLDFKEVKGQERAVYAALIAVCGNHNIIFEGSAGCGKSMISKRLEFLQTPMNTKEILEKVKLLLLEDQEVSFDELPHFSKNVLEALREPLEDNKILISRVNSKTKYETKFLFIGAMNPCPCGNLLSLNRNCRCNEMEIKRYKNRISEPLLDRIDLYVSMEEEKKDAKALYSSKNLHQRVISTFLRQKNRKQKNLNGKLNDEELEIFCVLNKSCKEILYKAVTNYNLSQRSINKVKKVARTIADIEGLENIDKKSILKALSFRFR